MGFSDICCFSLQYSLILFSEGWFANSLLDCDLETLFSQQLLPSVSWVLACFKSWTDLDSAILFGFFADEAALYVLFTDVWAGEALNCLHAELVMELEAEVFVEKRGWYFFPMNYCSRGFCAVSGFETYLERRLFLVDGGRRCLTGVM